MNAGFPSGDIETKQRAKQPSSIKLTRQFWKVFVFEKGKKVSLWKIDHSEVIGHLDLDQLGQEAISQQSRVFCCSFSPMVTGPDWPSESEGNNHFSRLIERWFLCHENKLIVSKFPLCFEELSLGGDWTEWDLFGPWPQTKQAFRMAALVRLCES